MAALGRLRVATGAEAETAAFPSSRHARLRLLLATSSDRDSRYSQVIVVPPQVSVPDCDWNKCGVERFGSWWYLGATISSSRLITEAQRDVKLAQDRDGLELGMAISKYVVGLTGTGAGHEYCLGTHFEK